MAALPYLGELLSLNIKSVRESKALLCCLKKATQGGLGFLYKPEYSTRYHTLGSNRVSCVFGEFEDSWNKYRERDGRVYEKNGIEILKAQPNATGRTYSQKCLITVKELKEACKENGLKTTGDKKTLLNALMKI